MEGKQNPFLFESNNENSHDDENISLDELRRRVRRQMGLYRASLPGKPNVSLNMQLEAVNFKLENNRHMDVNELLGTLAQLHYRFDMMDLADRIREYLDLDMPGIRTIDERECIKRCSSYALDEISKREIFGNPAPSQGREFIKPLYYLTAAMVSWNTEQVDQALTKLEDLRREAYAQAQERHISEVESEGR